MTYLDPYLTHALFDEPDAVPTRDGFGKALLELGETNKDVVVLCADLAESTRAHWFREKYPERYIEMGVAEQNLALVAAGLAQYGKIPFIASYAAFSPGRNNEQIRTNIALNRVPVKIAGMHAGVSVGPDGATHQALEDLGLMRMLPNMTVISPCDAEEARKATLAAAAHDGPVYVRFAREKTPLMTTERSVFEIGRANILWDTDGSEATIIATGPLVYNALRAAKALEREVRTCVINLHTIKPLDEATILAAAEESGAVVTVEEHQVAGGMGSAVAELLARESPTPVQFVGVRDRFGQSGDPDELIEHYGMGVSAIIAAVRRVLERKHEKKR